MLTDLQKEQTIETFMEEQNGLINKLSNIIGKNKVLEQFGELYDVYQNRIIPDETEKKVRTKIEEIKLKLNPFINGTSYANKKEASLRDEIKIQESISETLNNLNNLDNFNDLIQDIVKIFIKSQDVLIKELTTIVGENKEGIDLLKQLGELREAYQKCLFQEMKKTAAVEVSGLVKLDFIPFIEKVKFIENANRKTQQKVVTDQTTPSDPLEVVDKKNIIASINNKAVIPIYPPKLRKIVQLLVLYSARKTTFFLGVSEEAVKEIKESVTLTEKEVDIQSEKQLEKIAKESGITMEEIAEILPEEMLLDNDGTDLIPVNLIRVAHKCRVLFDLEKADEYDYGLIPIRSPLVKKDILTSETRFLNRLKGGMRGTLNKGNFNKAVQSNEALVKRLRELTENIDSSESNLMSPINFTEMYQSIFSQPKTTISEQATASGKYSLLLGQLPQRDINDEISKKAKILTVKMFNSVPETENIELNDDIINAVVELVLKNFKFNYLSTAVETSSAKESSSQADLILKQPTLIGSFFATSASQTGPVSEQPARISSPFTPDSVTSPLLSNQETISDQKIVPLPLEQSLPEVNAEAKNPGFNIADKIAKLVLEDLQSTYPVYWKLSSAQTRFVAKAMNRNGGKKFRIREDINAQELKKLMQDYASRKIKINDKKRAANVARFLNTAGRILVKYPSLHNEILECDHNLEMIVEMGENLKRDLNRVVNDFIKSEGETVELKLDNDQLVKNFFEGLRVICNEEKERKIVSLKKEKLPSKEIKLKESQIIKEYENYTTKLDADEKSAKELIEAKRLIQIYCDLSVTNEEIEEDEKNAIPATEYLENTGMREAAREFVEAGGEVVKEMCFSLV